MVRRLLLSAALSVVICMTGFQFAGARAGGGRLAPGTLLIASDKLADPNFAETVVFLVRHDADEGSMGLVLNRPAETTLSRAFPRMKATADPLFEGGPVAQDSVQALVRLSEKPEAAERVVGDIYSVVRKAALEKAIAERMPANKFRVYLGYAGWGPGQLENEVRQGAWTTATGVRYVFDRDPESLWQRLTRETQTELATLR